MKQEEVTALHLLPRTIDSLNKQSVLIITMSLTVCSKHGLQAEEKKVVDAINKQKDEIKKQEADVKNLVERIAAEIEREYMQCSEEPGKQ